MIVSKLDINHDWTFGKSLANYHKNNDSAISQNIKTRLLSFKNDWFLDTEANIDWINILGSKNNKQIIEDEVLRVTSQTFGVARVTAIEIITTQRKAKINVTFDTIYTRDVTIGVEI
ncbi:hypothetical protein [Francisella marina]|uniref:IraD/Gp25-like domain-containing protein n=1 Tax=Francisella marina TaxID=2249302 RepID=A0ABX5ZHR4_9GAMM|nr:hypothetical protein [Francisella marina]QEO57551.1 hypothetical protein F0R74_06685 [Francisella marina]